MLDRERDWLVIIDQFEEVFTQGQHDPAEAGSIHDQTKKFIAVLNQTVELSNGRVHVLLTLRADFLHRGLDFPVFKDLLQDNQFLLGQLEEVCLREAIKLPATKVGALFEKGLVERIVSDVAGQSGSLPLLQHALHELWQKRCGTWLTNSAYDDIGGVEGALRKRADETYGGLTDRQKKIARNIFVRLTTLGDGVSDTRRRATRSELYLSDFDRTEIDDVLTRLSGHQARLIETSEQSVEVTHEAVIQKWSLLREWLDANRNAFRIHRRLTEVANEWTKSHADKRKRDTTLLYTGTRLAMARELTEKQDQSLNEIENDFLAASTQSVRARKFRKFITWVGTAAAFMLIAVVGTLVARNNQNTDHAQTLVEDLKKANESQYPDSLRALEEYRRWANGPLNKLFMDPATDRLGKLNAALALAPVDVSVIPHLRECLLTATPGQFPFIRTTLKKYDPQHVQQIDDLWKTAEDVSTPLPKRFQAACALATYAPDDARWANVSDTVAEYLVGLSATEFVAWRGELRPAGSQLQQSLTKVFRTSPTDRQRRQFAAETLGEFASNNGGLLAELLMDADPETFERLKIAAEQVLADAIARLHHELEANINLPSEEERDKLAQRRSHAVVALIRLGKIEALWPRLAFNPIYDQPETSDPRLRTELIHDLADYGIDSTILFEQLHVEQDTSTRRGILLALGQYSDERLPADLRSTLIDKLLSGFEHDPDAGLHGTIEWLLRKWGFDTEVAMIVERMRPKDKKLQGHEAIGNKQWFLNSQGQSFTVFSAGEFQMGSPETELGRVAEMEKQHRERIEYQFAMSTLEVTRKQYLAFVTETGASDPNNKYVKTDDSPQTGVTWFDAASYCNWLSKQEGIDQIQWCFDLSDMQDGVSNIKAKSQFLKLGGYRLPTNAEWEYACRAGATTSRHFGNSDARLTSFSWYLKNGEERVHPVGRKMPNDAGLFDMLGNSYEWCHDLLFYYPFGTSPVPNRTGDLAVAVNPKHPRILRSGSFLNPSFDLRSSYRSQSEPGSGINFIGFRVARTYHGPSKP